MIKTYSVDTQNCPVFAPGANPILLTILSVNCSILRKAVSLMSCIFPRKDVAAHIFPYNYVSTHIFPYNYVWDNEGHI